jgi:hypothetical protein
MRLTKGMYGHEFHGTSNLFGIHCGQMRSMRLNPMTPERSGKVFHNASWFNGQGQKLGWGDLSWADIDRIVAELEPDEVFLVLSESSFWNHVTRPSIIGAMAATDGNENEFPLEEVVAEAMMAIFPKEFHMIRRYETRPELMEPEELLRRLQALNSKGATSVSS